VRQGRYTATMWLQPLVTGSLCPQEGHRKMDQWLPLARGQELRAYTLSHSTSPMFVKGFGDRVS
jgi:hypothetical protein